MAITTADSSSSEPSPAGIHYLQFNSHGQRPLFAQRSDYHQLLGLFEQLHQEEAIPTLTFCLLPHSIHWIMLAPISQVHIAGQWLQAAYTQLYNEQQQRNGSLFQKQFAYRQLETFHEFPELSHQIHHLPVAGKLVPDPAIYPWSSHKLYLSRDTEHPSWFAAAPLLNRIANQRASQIRRYSQFMTPAPANMHLLNSNNSISGGTANLREETHEHALTEAASDHGQPADIDWLIAFVCEEYQVSPTDLQLWRRHRLMGEIKSTIAHLALEWQIADIETLADALAWDADLLQAGVRYLHRQKPLSLHRLYIAVEHYLGVAPKTTTTTVEIEEIESAKLVTEEPSDTEAQDDIEAIDLETDGTDQAAVNLLNELESSLSTDTQQP